MWIRDAPISKKKKKVFFLKSRTKLILLGFIVGPVIGCGLIANFYFKDNSAFRIICYELNEDSKHLANWRIKLDVIINSKVFNEFLGN